MIDNKLQYSIKILNQKKYYTSTCCASHYNVEYKTFAMYISFRDNINLNSFPEGWQHRHNNYIYTIFKAKTETEFNNKQTEKINNLNKWIIEEL